MSTPVAGPGPFSRRTDMTQKMRNLPNPDYGEGASYKDLQRAAPMAASPSLPPGVDFSSLFGNPADRVVPLGQDTMQPNTPVTDGAALGAGADMSALGDPESESKQRNASYMVFLEWMANQPGTSDSARNAIRQMKYNTL